VLAFGAASELVIASIFVDVDTLRVQLVGLLGTMSILRTELSCLEDAYCWSSKFRTGCLEVDDGFVFTL
jgi:hypothetical protein